MSEQFYTVDQVASSLGLHPKTVLRFIREGRLRGTRIGKSYRILRSDMEALAGLAAGQRPAAARARVTAVVEIDDIAIASAERIASFVNAAIMSDTRRPDATHLTTAYDPEKQSLKLVAIGTPSDTAGLLNLVQLQLENLR